MTYDEAPSVTLQNYARSLLGCDHKHIHQDLARLGYLYKPDDAWQITPLGRPYFFQHWAPVEPDRKRYPPSVRATAAGGELISLHYELEELSMKPLLRYRDVFDSRRDCYDPGRVARFILRSGVPLDDDDIAAIALIRDLNGVSDLDFDQHRLISHLVAKHGIAQAEEDDGRRLGEAHRSARFSVNK